MTTYADYWACQPADAPGRTGADGLMDCPDIREVLDVLDVTLHDKRVLDIGCGTGRLAALCGPGYLGVDVSHGMVGYARSQGVNAQHTDDPVRGDFDVVVFLSVFTHITRRDRDRYLTLAAEKAPVLLADILPAGRDDFSIPASFSDPTEFEHDLEHAGYQHWETYGRTAHTGYGHRYYHAWQ